MNTTTVDLITDEVIENAYSYEEYRKMIDDLLEEEKTTGDNHSEAMIHYTNMNVHRMNRLDKRAELSDSLKQELDDIDRSNDLAGSYRGLVRRCGPEPSCHQQNG